jgi:FkbM family methyltransferase
MLTLEAMIQPTRKSHTILVHVLQALTASIATFTIASFIWPATISGTGLYLEGRSDAPTVAESVEAERIRLALEKISAHLAKTSRLVEKDDSKDIELWETERGRYWVPSHGSMLQFYDIIGEQDTDIYGTGESGVHKGDVVLDCGGSVGLFTRKALDSGARLVVTIEPSPRSVECIRRNFEKEISEGRVVIAPLGVWDKEDYLVLEVDEHGEWGNSFAITSSTKTAGPRVRLTTIDTLVKELKLPRVDFIKMDIEGAEKPAIAGARGTILRNTPRLALCTYHLPVDAVAIPQLIRSYNPNYRSQSLYEYEGRQARLRSKVVRFF